MKQPAVIELAIVQGKMLARNVSFWSVSLLIAGLSMLVFGYLFKPDARPFDLAVVDEDATQTSQSLTAAFEEVENVHVSTLPRDEEMQRFEDGKLGRGRHRPARVRGRPHAGPDAGGGVFRRLRPGARLIRTDYGRRCNRGVQPAR